MNTHSTAPRSDTELLDLSRTALLEQGFQVEILSDGIDLVLAEDTHFIVAVAAMSTVRDLILAEPFAYAALAKRIEAVALGPKTWDTYLVLLTQELAAESDSITRDLYSINYDTSRLRRIAHIGVAPTPSAVISALASFAPPSASYTTAAQTDAMRLLLQALIARGVSDDLAQRAVAAFAQGASLDDVL